MNPPSKPLSLRKQAQSAQEKKPVLSHQEFTSVEELLRHDAALTSVPRTVAERIQKSVPSRSLWQRIFGGKP
jgi:hypothetical protein